MPIMPQGLLVALPRSCSLPSNLSSAVGAGISCAVDCSLKNLLQGVPLRGWNCVLSNRQPDWVQANANAI